MVNVVFQLVNVNGSIFFSSDIDYFKVMLLVGKMLFVMLIMVSSNNDFDFYVKNSLGMMLARSEKVVGQVDSMMYVNGGFSSVMLYVQVLCYSGMGVYMFKLQW